MNEQATPQRCIALCAVLIEENEKLLSRLRGRPRDEQEREMYLGEVAAQRLRTLYSWLCELTTVHGPPAVPAGKQLPTPHALQFPHVSRAPLPAPPGLHHPTVPAPLPTDIETQGLPPASMTENVRADSRAVYGAPLVRDVTEEDLRHAPTCVTVENPESGATCDCGLATFLASRGQSGSVDTSGA